MQLAFLCRDVYEYNHPFYYFPVPKFFEIYSRKKAENNVSSYYGVTTKVCRITGYLIMDNRILITDNRIADNGLTGYLITDNRMISKLNI